MAKRRSKKSVRRDVKIIARPRPARHKNLKQTIINITTLDRRNYHPLGINRPAKTLRDTTPNIVVPTKKEKRHRQSNLARVTFANPKDVLTCLRRSVRKQVIHAKRKSGKKGQRKPIRNRLSQIGCK